jgi:CubicO group peptidase (beta-lactamase class C family)
MASVTGSIARLLAGCLGVSVLAASPVAGQAPSDTVLPAATRATIDSVARAVLAATGVPSASVAVVIGGRIAYRQAYGSARLAPAVAALPDMRYAVGSVSKQFTATAVLMLAQEGKLSLSDPVSRYVPGLTRGDEVTVRELLSHTSGYQDYWPQDYVMPAMLVPTTADAIMTGWAKKALDFDPGTQWQYSNTNYVIAGRIIEQVSGMSLMQFLQTRIFAPLGMQSIADVNAGRLGETDAIGYYRHALGPLRPAPKEAAGWLFAAGELAMTAPDLARWDISIIDRRLLSPAWYDTLTAEVKLKNGSDTHYALGIFVASDGGHRVWEHSGEVSGFTSEDIVLPDTRAAVVVLTNQDASSAAGQIGQRVAHLLVPPTSAQSPQTDDRVAASARSILTELQQGRLQRSLFTDNANAYFSAEAVHDYASSLAPLGAPRQFCQTGRDERGGMVFRAFLVVFAQRAVVISTYQMPDGKLEQYLIFPARSAAAGCQK